MSKILHSSASTSQHELELIIYSTVGCHLCELAEAELGKLQLPEGFVLPVVELDISNSDELIERYGEKIPVFALSFHGQVSNQVLCWPFSVEDIAVWLNRTVELLHDK